MRSPSTRGETQVKGSRMANNKHRACMMYVCRQRSTTDWCLVCDRNLCYCGGGACHACVHRDYSGPPSPDPFGRGARVAEQSGWRGVRLRVRPRTVFTPGWLDWEIGRVTGGGGDSPHLPLLVTCGKGSSRSMSRHMRDFLHATCLDWGLGRGRIFGSTE